MLDVLYQLICKETTPELTLMCLRTSSIRESYVFCGQFLDHTHTLLDVCGVVTVVVSIQEEGAVSNDSELTIGLSLEVVAP